MMMRVFKQSIFWIAVSCAALHASWAHAEAKLDLRTLHQLQLDLLEVASQFHRYQGSEGNKKYYLSISSKLDGVKKALTDTVNALENYGLTNEAQTLKTHSQEYLKNLNTALASIKNGGFAAFSVIDAYLNAHDAILSALSDAYLAINSAGGYSVPPRVAELRGLTLLMQRMYTKYIEVSSSQFGYTPRSGQENAETIDDLAARFTRNLEELKNAIPVNSPYAPRINDVQTTWLFLEKSFVNYNEKSVPYLITKFGNQIIEELSAIAEEMESEA
ncbi:MAG: hypothetical protein R3208_04285 [Ketobacteraceae bacterium]|nr:hypothetical protein [Ketobacteraceae bacterium]